MRRCLAGLAIALCTLATHAAAAQAVYGQVSASRFTNLIGTDYLYGATVGVLVGGPPVVHRIRLSCDIQGRFVAANGEKFDGVAVGPRFSFQGPHGIAPYGEFLVGFARYNNPNEGGATTDSTIQMNAGIAKQVSAHWDLTADYSYAQYYALGGEYSPKTYSLGTIFHFVKR